MRTGERLLPIAPIPDLRHQRNRSDPERNGGLLTPTSKCARLTLWRRGHRDLVRRVGGRRRAVGVFYSPESAEAVDNGKSWAKPSRYIRLTFSEWRQPLRLHRRDSPEGLTSGTNALSSPPGSARTRLDGSSTGTQNTSLTGTHHHRPASPCTWQRYARRSRPRQHRAPRCYRPPSLGGPPILTNYASRKFTPVQELQRLLASWGAPDKLSSARDGRDGSVVGFEPDVAFEVCEAVTSGARTRCGVRTEGGECPVRSFGEFRGPELRGRWRSC